MKMYAVGSQESHLQKCTVSHIIKPSHAHCGENMGHWNPIDHKMCANVILEY